MDRNEKLTLKCMARGIADGGRWCGEKVRATTGERRASWRRTKAIIGTAARYVLLTLALLREVPYRVLEAKTRHPVVIERLVRLVAAHGDHADRARWTKEAIRAWLDSPEPATHVAVRRAAEDAGRRKLQARREVAAGRRRPAVPSEALLVG